MKIFLSLLISFSALAPTALSAGIGPCDYSTAELAYPGPETAVVMVWPDGGGSPMTAARTFFGNVDATITLTLLDCSASPVPNYPREDLWLTSADGGLAGCLGGTIADANTDAEGAAFWVQPLRAGGSSEALTVVLVNGAALATSAGLNISFNSPDLNGDLTVNLTDVALFASDFFGGAYMFRSDLYYDSVVNLSDVVKMIEGMGATCP